VSPLRGLEEESAGPRPPHFVRQPWLSMGQRYAPL